MGVRIQPGISQDAVRPLLFSADPLKKQGLADGSTGEGIPSSSLPAVVGEDGPLHGERSQARKLVGAGTSDPAVGSAACCCGGLWAVLALHLPPGKTASRAA